MRKQLRPQPAAVARATQSEQGRKARPRSAVRQKVMRLMEAMVDAAYEDLTSGAEKPRVSFGQALRAGELLVRYEEKQQEAEKEAAAAEELPPMDEAEITEAEIAELEARYGIKQVSEEEMRAAAKRIVAEEQAARSG